MIDIEKQFDIGIQTAYNLMYNQQLNSIVSYCRNLVNVVLPAQKGYNNQTGNTVTSYSFGVYYNGKFVYFGTNGMKDPVRAKLKKGETWSGTNYDGYNVRITGGIDTDGGYGEDTSYHFLRSYTPRGNSFSVVVTTGTEYSTYLENKKHLNVLTDSIDKVSSDFIGSFKPIG